MPFNHPVSRETSINLSVIAVALWLLSYAMVLAYFRQRTLKPGPAVEELRDESPAQKHGQRDGEQGMIAGGAHTTPWVFIQRDGSIMLGPGR